MSEFAASNTVNLELDKVVQNYFRQQQNNLKSSDVETLIRNFNFQEERDFESSMARRA